MRPANSGARVRGSQVRRAGCLKLRAFRLLVLTLFLAGLAERGLAHPILQNPVWIEVAPEKMRVNLYVSVRELGVVQGLPIGLDGALDRRLALETAPRHSPYVLDHLDFRADGIPLSGSVVEIVPPGEIGEGAEAPDRAHFIYRIDYPFSVPPGLISFTHTMVKEFPSAPGVDWDLSYAYRFGAPGAVPKVFGALPREMSASYRTGYAPVTAGALEGAGGVSAPVEIRQHMLRLALLGAALGLGATRRGLLRKTAGLAGGSLFTGWAGGVLSGALLPGFASAAMAGIGILLASVDNIHRPAAETEKEEGRSPARRLMLSVLFPAAAGWALAGAGGAAHGWREGAPSLAFGLTVLLGGCLAGSGLVLRFSPSSPLSGQETGGISGAEGPELSSPPIAGRQRGGLAQLASLAVCAGGLAVLFEGLGIRPWAYWFGKF